MPDFVKGLGNEGQSDATDHLHPGFHLRSFGLSNFFCVHASRNPFPIPLVIEGGVSTSLNREGAKMHNPHAFDAEMQMELEFLGAEPLAGSGFENEQTDPDFNADQFAGEGA
jgi:hypothetical protein